MAKGDNKSYPLKNLSDRGMTVKPCPIGTGVIVLQDDRAGQGFTAHLTLPEARELANHLTEAIRTVRQNATGTKTVRSLYAEGKRFDEIADALNMTIDQVKAELAACKILKKLSGENPSE